MTEERLFELIDPALRDSGAAPEPGEEFRDPPLDVLKYYRRPVRLGPVPVLGRALGAVAVVRQPVDVGFGEEPYARLLLRVGMAVNGRFPPWKGLVVGLTTLVLTPEPIGPGDDATLGKVLTRRLKRLRVVPFGLIRANLGQEALAFALSASPDGMFPESERLADLLSGHLRRYVPLLET